MSWQNSQQSDRRPSSDVDVALSTFFSISYYEDHFGYSGCSLGACGERRYVIAAAISILSQGIHSGGKALTRTTAIDGLAIIYMVKATPRGCAS